MPILLNLNGKEPFDFIKPESDNNAFASDVDMTILLFMSSALCQHTCRLERRVKKFSIVMIA